MATPAGGREATTEQVASPADVEAEDHVVAVALAEGPTNFRLLRLLEQDLDAGLTPPSDTAPTEAVEVDSSPQSSSRALLQQYLEANGGRL